jgi:gluconate 2-dehydrogenase gamma chain
MDAVCECLIPADDLPGAREAGVVHYIDRQLTLFFKSLQADYRAGLAALDRYSASRHSAHFAALTLEQQTLLLTELEKGAAPEQFFAAGLGRRVFDLWLNHTMQGFYGNPRHGGNREFASWRMLGVPPVQVRGRLHYQQPPENV